MIEFQPNGCSVRPVAGAACSVEPAARHGSAHSADATSNGHFHCIERAPATRLRVGDVIRLLDGLYIVERINPCNAVCRPQLKREVRLCARFEPEEIVFTASSKVVAISANSEVEIVSRAKNFSRASSGASPRDNEGMAATDAEGTAPKQVNGKCANKPELIAGERNSLFKVTAGETAPMDSQESQAPGSPAGGSAPAAPAAGEWPMDFQI